MSVEFAVGLRRSLVISTFAIGAQKLQLEIDIDPRDRTFTGTGKVTQPVHPPMGVSTEVRGKYQEVVMGGRISYRFEGTGSNPIEPIEPSENFQIRMDLGADFDHGTATFRYLSAGAWHKVEDAKVKPAGEVPES